MPHNKKYLFFERTSNIKENPSLCSDVQVLLDSGTLQVTIGEPFTLNIRVRLYKMLSYKIDFQWRKRSSFFILFKSNIL